MKAKDWVALDFLYHRLIEVYREKEQFDYMLTVRKFLDDNKPVPRFETRGDARDGDRYCLVGTDGKVKLSRLNKANVDALIEVFGDIPIFE